MTSTAVEAYACGCQRAGSSRWCAHFGLGLFVPAVAADFLDLFQRIVLDEPYRLRLRRHYRLSGRSCRKRGVEPVGRKE